MKPLVNELYDTTCAVRYINYHQQNNEQFENRKDM